MQKVIDLSTPAQQRKYVKINVYMQLPKTKPTVCVFATQYVRTYKRYLENKIRDNWDFQVFQ
jgi:predicted GTPase